MKYRAQILHFAAIALLWSPRVVAQPPRYVVYDLGPNLTVTGMNNSGQVIGFTQTEPGVTRAFRTLPNRAMKLPADDLGTLGGTSTVARGINSSGEVVGDSANSSGEVRAFRTAPNSAINPSTDDVGSLGGPLLSGSLRTEAFGINDSGQVVGGASAPAGIIQAFRTSSNAAINPATDDIGSLTFSPAPANLQSIARSIDAGGDVVGSFVGGLAIYATAFVYHSGATTEIPCFIVAPFGNNFTGMNDNGQIAGTNACSDSFPPSIAVWQNGRLTNVAVCDCEPHGINNSLQIVGRGFTFGPNHAFLFQDGKLSDLNDLIPSNSRWVLVDAVAINDHGQIAGSGQLNGLPHAFRLDPLPVSAKK